jgi:hypothetical protein
MGALMGRAVLVAAVIQVLPLLLELQTQAVAVVELEAAELPRRRLAEMAAQV